MIHVKTSEERKKHNELRKAATMLGWSTIASIIAVTVSGVMWLATTLERATPHTNQANVSHAHGLSYASDGSKLFVAAHDGLRIYQNGNLDNAHGEHHDYMGFSMADDGFYSSGHPAPGSNKKNPFGIVKSTDEGKSLETLALYGQVDFHGMSVGYKSHVIYVFNFEPNEKMKSVGLYYSKDDANNWTKSQSSGLDGQAQTLAVHPTDPSIVVIATDKGLFISKDNGNRFERAAYDRPVTSIVFDSDGLLWVGGTQGGSTLSRLDLGNQHIQDVKLPNLGKDAIEFITRNPKNPQQIAIMTLNNTLYVTTNLREQWKAIAPQGA